MAETFFQEFFCFCKHKKKGINPDMALRSLALPSQKNEHADGRGSNKQSSVLENFQTCMYSSYAVFIYTLRSHSKKRLSVKSVKATAEAKCHAHANCLFGSEIKDKYTHDFFVFLSPSLADTELQLRRDSIFSQSLVAAICTFSEQLLAALNYRYNNNGEYEESSRDASRKWLEQIAATGVLLNYQSLLSPAVVR